MEKVEAKERKAKDKSWTEADLQKLEEAAEQCMDGER